MAIEIVKGLSIIGESGERLLGTPIGINNEIQELEKRIFVKAKETEGNILLFEEYIILYKIVEDICILLYSDSNENEIMLYNALDSFYSAVVKTIKGPLSQKSLIKHYDEVFLLLDAFIYKSILVTDSSTEMYSSVPKRTFEGLEAIQIPSKFSSALKKAQKSFTSTWFKK
ncbi:coatomer subunit zeta [Nematocida sp. AWRm80]|nr:coatomer subunit zeta [Nematocida sp. AWRm80]